MLIAIVHGYFLKGTGSNLYVKNLCRELCLAGHDVMLFCQESDFGDADFVQRYVEFDGTNQLLLPQWERETTYAGKCTSFRPNIGEVLPVFVKDNYSGYVASELTQMAKTEIETYLGKNERAIRTSFLQGRPDLVISNHTVMQPVYAGRVCSTYPGCRHYMVVHGSCLNFSVRKSELLQNYAREAIAGSERIVFVSDFSRREFLEFFQYDEAVAAKSIVIPAGVDVDKFTPLENSQQKEVRLAKCLAGLTLKQSLKPGRTVAQKREFAQHFSHMKNSADVVSFISAENLPEIDNWSTDGDTVDRLKSINWSQDKVVLFYGKYLWTKGIHVLLSAIPEIFLQQPDTYFILVGFGSFRYYLEALVAALANGQREIFFELLKRPTAFAKDIDENSTLYFTAFLDKFNDPIFADAYFNSAAARLEKQVIFTGFMEHEFLRELISCSDITVAPSIFPEAFGLVAVEALACGVIPLQTNHSGFTEIIRDYIGSLQSVFKPQGLKSLYLDSELVLNLANNITSFLNCYEQMSELERITVRKRARKVAVDKYSWQAMARLFLEFGSQENP